MTRRFLMRLIMRLNLRYIGGLLLLALMVNPAGAHLMVAQHGTLNRVGDGVFMVLSLPVSAFTDTDDDGDGKLSNTEFSKHRLRIVNAINTHIKLLDAAGPRPLEGMMLSPVAPHDDPTAPVEQLVLMGRFVLAQPPEQPSAIGTTLYFHAGLFGSREGEQLLSVTATDKASGRKHKMHLSPEQNRIRLFTED